MAQKINLAEQAERIRKRIVYAESVMRSGGTTAILKAWVLPNLYRALHKTRLGTYESCDECGQPIGVRRLEKTPGAIRCMRCQKEHEEKDFSTPLS